MLDTDVLREQIKQVHDVQKRLSLVGLEQRNNFLIAVSKALETQKEAIFQANERDVRAAKDANLATPLIKRLRFDEQKLATACAGLVQIAKLPDPIDKILLQRELDERLILSKVTCPIGVIGMIFESRPDALIQIASLCLKSGNGIVLKGGSEALATNRVLTSIFKEVSEHILPKDVLGHWIHLLETREAVAQMLEMNDLIDLIIPRGSNSFVKYIMDHTTIPVLGHADGICHCYLDSSLDLETALRVSIDSKCQYPAACNAIETILVHKDSAESVLPKLCAALEEHGVEIRGDSYVQGICNCTPAVEADWSTEYLDLIVSIKLVDSLEEAVTHINTYGSSHTDCIVTDRPERAEYFMNAVDSAGVYWNCSTRFADGFRYGLGAEVGISTHKIHARGPVGLEGLISYKWKLCGDGQIVEEYSGPDARTFTHRDL